MEADARCELCQTRAAYATNDGGVGPHVPLCQDHYRYVEAEVTRDRQRSTSDRCFGYGRTSGLPGDHSLTCDKCAATWTGHGGQLCPWCHGTYARQLRYQREALLRPTLDVEPDDRNYRRAVKSHSERVIRALEVGLVTPDEARKVVRRLLARPEEVSS